MAIRKYTTVEDVKVNTSAVSNTTIPSFVVDVRYSFLFEELYILHI